MLVFPTLVASILLLTASPVPSQQTDPSNRSDDIVVTGQRLETTEKGLAACLARHCPPEQDIDATLAHAENQFVAGRYKDARHTLLASIGRNRRYAKQYPIAVSDLFRANSRIAGHLGEGDDERISMVDVISTLKKGFNENDFRVIEAQAELADTYAQLGRFDEAEDLYKTVRDKAKQLNQPSLEGFAMLHLASLYQNLSTKYPQYRPLAINANKALAQLSDPRMRSYVLAGQVLQARMSAKNGDNKAIDDLIASMPQRTDKPVLLYAPAPKLPQDSERGINSGDVLTKLPTGNFDGQWVDIGFWIEPDGTVADADVLRQSPSLDGEWFKPLVAAIDGRRYAPLSLPSNDPGVFHVERYTYTAYWTRVTGSRLRQRHPAPEIQMLDLTAEKTDGHPSGG